MEDELTIISTSWERDGDGSLLRCCLEAHIAHERALARLRVTVRLWLAVAAVVWLEAAWPALLGAPWRVPVLVGWLGVAPAVLGFSFAERYWSRRLEESLRLLEPETAESSR